MKLIFKIIFFIILFLEAGISFGQINNQHIDYIVDTSKFYQLVPWEREMIDTSMLEYTTLKSDTERVSFLYNMYSGMNDNDVWVYYLEELNSILETDDLKLKNTKFYNIYKSRYYNDMGYYFKYCGMITKSLDYYSKSLSIGEKIGDKEGTAITLINLGANYLQQEDYENALNYFKKSLSEMQELNNISGIATSLNNIGVVHNRTGNKKSAIKYYTRAIEYQKQLGNKAKMANGLNSIGLAYTETGEFEKGMRYLFESLEIRKKANNPTSILHSYINIAKKYLDQKQYDKVSLYVDSANQIIDLVKYPIYIRELAYIQTHLKKEQGDWEGAFEYYERYIIMRDSILNKESQKATIKQQSKYEYEKQKALDDVENEKKVAIEKEKQERQFIILIITIIAGFIVAILLLIIYRRLQLTKRQKLIIEEQKEEVESQRDQIEEQRDDIMASITYAKRIQEAILPSLKTINGYLPESFIYYQPKDVVAGDFYWSEKVKNKVYIAAADCTGHGVPGAMVSVVCSNALSKSLLEEGNTDVGILLDRTRHLVIERLAKSGDIKDGMDISLACFDFENMKLDWAGANNPLYLIRDGEFNITKGDREPIGFTDNATPFTNHSIKLNTGDQIYLFTDGFADQFGGEKDKKFGNKQFKELLLSNQDKTMQQQKEVLDTTFQSWMQQSGAEQVDDVCVIGVKI